MSERKPRRRLPAMKVIETDRLTDPHLDVSEDRKTVILAGRLPNNIALRLPMSAETAMRVLALLSALQEQAGFPRSERPVNIDKMQ